MKKYLFLSSAILLTGCNTHVGYGDIATALGGNGLHRNQTVERKASLEECAVHATAQAANRAENEVRRLKSQLANAEGSLADNRAWQNGSCVIVEMKALPPRPDTLSENEIAFQAIGSCMDITMRRHPMVDVVQAFSSIRKEEFLKIGAEWSNGHHESCASIEMSQVDDWAIRNVCGILGAEARWGCMQNRVMTCIEQVAQSCGATLEAWQRQTDLIKSEPQSLLTQCQTSVQEIKEAQHEIPNAEATARLNSEEHNQLAQARVIVPASTCRL